MRLVSQTNPGAALVVGEDGFDREGDLAIITQSGWGEVVDLYFSRRQIEALVHHLTQALHKID